MKLLRFNVESLERLRELGESGMEFWIVRADWNNNQDKLIAVRGDGHAMPLEETEDTYSLDDMLNGVLLPGPEDLLEVRMTQSPSVQNLRLPTGFVPSHGALPLLGSITLAYPTRFFRYTSSPTDPRFHSPGSIVKDTYLTSFNDQLLVNSGFGAVGRYALPMPMPASYKHDYTLPAGTQLRVGTVTPLFGQAGGGVELKTTSVVSGVVANPTSPIDDY